MSARARVCVCVRDVRWGGAGDAHRRAGVRLAEFVPRPSDRAFALLSFGKAAAAVTPLPIGAADVRRYCPRLCAPHRRV